MPQIVQVCISSHKCIHKHSSCEIRKEWKRRRKPQSVTLLWGKYEGSRQLTTRRETPVPPLCPWPVRPLQCRLFGALWGVKGGPLLCPSVLCLEAFPGGQLGASGADQFCKSHLGRGDCASELGGPSPEMAGAEGSRQKELRCLRRWVLVRRRETAGQALSFRKISDSNSKDAKALTHLLPWTLFLLPFFF